MEYYHNDKSKIIDGIKAKGVSVDYDITMQEIPEKIGEITEVDLQEKEVEITENGTTTVEPDEDHNGLTSVEITVNVPQGDYFKDNENVPVGNDGSHAVYNSSNIAVKYIKELPDNLPVGTSLYNAFSGMEELTKAPVLLNTSSVTNAQGAFRNCKKLTDTSAMENYDLSSVTDTRFMFEGCTSLKVLPALNTGNVVDGYGMFTGCSSLETIGLIDFGSLAKTGPVSYQSLMPSPCVFKDVAGFKDLGKGFDTSISEHDGAYQLLINSTVITRQSMLNIINNVYDIATKGVARQYITFNRAVQNQITAEEIAVATAKGWDVRFS